MKSKQPLIKKSSLGEEAADVIRTRIYGGNLMPGERITEASLSEELDISRACVRDAMMLLETEGLIIRQVNKGAAVKSFTKKEVHDLLEARHMIEFKSAVICMENSCLPVRGMEEQIDKMEKANRLIADGVGAEEELFNADMTFHSLITEAANNAYLSMFWSSVSSQYKMLMLRLFRVREEYFMSGVSVHRDILDALKNGADKNFIESLMYSHAMANYESVSKCIL